MISTINTSFPQAPLVVPQIVANGPMNGSIKAPATSVETAKPVLPTGAAGAVVNLKA